MREIRFRVWTGKQMQNVEVIDFGAGRSMDYYNWYDGYCGESFPFDLHPLMQFTGLKDKNGIEIYEGDVITYGRPFHGIINTVQTGKIVYNEYCGAFQIAYKNIYDSFVTDFAHQYTILEVIGNLYEHPDLLK